MATMCVLPRAKNCRSCEPSLSRGCAKCGATPCPGCSFDPTRAIFGLSGSEPTRGIISAALKLVRFAGNAKLPRPIKGDAQTRCM